VEPRGVRFGAGDQMTALTAGVNFGGKRERSDQADALNAAIEQSGGEFVSDGGNGEDIEQGETFLSAGAQSAERRAQSEDSDQWQKRAPSPA
jgi:hypothetical protein